MDPTPATPPAVQSGIPPWQWAAALAESKPESASELQNAEQVSPAAFTCGTGYVTALAANAASTWYTYIGATVAAGATTAAPAGDYTGTVTLTATFSTF